MSDDTVSFKVNGIDYTVSGESVSSRLVNYLNDTDTVGSSGTHVTCFEGGCGACTVVAKVPVPGASAGETKSFCFNSCLASLYGCDGWEITTIEGLGNKTDGYGTLQQKLTNYNGTQCGFCSPGMVMNMHGLTQSTQSWTPEDVERHLDGNICRCTGYRPILDAFKSVTVGDIEDSANIVQSCCKKRNCCKDAKAKGKSTKIVRKKVPKEIIVNGNTWYQPTSLAELQSILTGLGSTIRFKIVVGNTGAALYDDGPYSVYINTFKVPELYSITTSSSAASFGLNLSMHEMMLQFDILATSTPVGFGYLAEINKHWQNVANTSVRNLGSVGGNLNLRNLHPEFPSDLFVTLVAAGATVTIASSDGSTQSISIESLVGIDFIGTKTFLQSLELTTLSSSTVYRSFKVMPRNANSKATISASFALEIDTSSGKVVTGSPIMAFTGLSSTFVRATNAETYLVGKDLSNPAVLQLALTFLYDEITTDETPADTSGEYRKLLAQNLFYKYALGICSDTASSTYLTGADDLIRPLSSGLQTLNLNTDLYPLGEPLVKYEGLLQCAGEAEYVKTSKPIVGELVGMFVTSTVANADIVSIDSTAALAITGVVAFYSADDITGDNNLIVFSDPIHNEELFASTNVSYYGQPLGLIVATNRGAAYAGISTVSVTYANEVAPILTIEDAVAAGNTVTIPGFAYKVGDVDAGFLASDVVFTGSMKRGSQFHFHMETQVCLAVPIEDGLDIFASSQWLQETQASISQITGLSANQINVSNKRIGGAFGAKIDRCNFTSTASALAAQLLQKPVRVDLDLNVNMAMLGWRDPYLCTYKVGVMNTGALVAIQATLTCDTGHTAVGASSYFAPSAMPSCYDCPNWDVDPQVVKTNTASNTWTRAPSTVEGITFMENIMEHVAVAVNMDPLDARRINIPSESMTRMAMVRNPRMRAALRAMGPRGQKLLRPRPLRMPKSSINSMLDELIASSNFYARRDEVELYNTNNRWRKKGIGMMPLIWPYEVPSVYGFSVIISIYAHDGSVAINHAGIEVGQGMHTRLAQVVAYVLGCDYDKIKVKATNTTAGANSQVTAGSLGSNFNMHCVNQCALLLAARVSTIQKPTWEEKVAEAFSQGISLTEHYWNGPDEVLPYGVEAVCCSEIELDLLSGQFLITRTDILEDVGKSPSPLMDLGQIEGGFVMGQGLMTTEKILYDPVTGRKITDTTWLYKPPSAMDIPVDFRVTFLANSSNPIGVLDSKVTGEPPVCLGNAVVMALREAITSAREDAGTTGWFTMDAPMTIDNIQTLCLVDPNTFTYGNN